MHIVKHNICSDLQLMHKQNSWRELKTGEYAWGKDKDISAQRVNKLR